MFRKMLDSSRSNSLGNKFRRRRFRIFADAVKDYPKPVRILDLGGNENFWIQMGLAGNKEFEITLVNPEPVETTAENIKYINGDACRFLQLKLQFDVIFSNSVIEHLGSIEKREQMVHQILASEKSYCIQTPNYYFPFEPHFLFPFFQFFPKSLKIFLVRTFNMGWFTRCRSENEAVRLVDSIRLLRAPELKHLFPGAELIRERFFLMTKSFIVLKRN